MLTIKLKNIFYLDLRCFVYIIGKSSLKSKTMFIQNKTQKLEMVYL